MTNQIKRVLAVPVLGAFYYDDQAAIRNGAVALDGQYIGAPMTAGFSSVRMPAHALSVGLQLSDGFVAWGDMMSVQYAAAAGREPVFNGASSTLRLQGELGERLAELPLTDLRNELSNLFRPLADGNQVTMAEQYGISQAVLRAFAHLRNCTIAEVLTKAYSLPLIAQAVPIYAQSGDDRRANTQKMITKRVPILPHGLINSPAKFGTDGREFFEFAGWVADSCRATSDSDYKPTLHFDLYGNAGLAFNQDPRKIAAFIARVSERVAPFMLNIESPVDYGSVSAQIDGFLQIKSELKALGCRARLVADEWCDSLNDIARYAKDGAADIVQIKTPDVGSLTQSLEAILLCKQHGIGAHLGGSCSETDLSARACVHVAVAGQADMQLAKPGMGVDEGLSIVANEQSRLLATIA